MIKRLILALIIVGSLFVGSTTILLAQESLIGPKLSGECVPKEYGPGETIPDTVFPTLAGCGSYLQRLIDYYRDNPTIATVVPNDDANCGGQGQLACDNVLLDGATENSCDDGYAPNSVGTCYARGSTLQQSRQYAVCISEGGSVQDCEYIFGGQDFMNSEYAKAIDLCSGGSTNQKYLPKSLCQEIILNIDDPNNVDPESIAYCISVASEITESEASKPIWTGLCSKYSYQDIKTVTDSYESNITNPPLSTFENCVVGTENIENCQALPVNDSALASFKKKCQIFGYQPDQCEEIITKISGVSVTTLENCINDYSSLSDQHLEELPSAFCPKKVFQDLKEIVSSDERNILMSNREAGYDVSQVAPSDESIEEPAEVASSKVKKQYDECSEVITKNGSLSKENCIKIIEQNLKSNKNGEFFARCLLDSSFDRECLDLKGIVIAEQIVTVDIKNISRISDECVNGGIEKEKCQQLIAENNTTTLSGDQIAACVKSTGTSSENCKELRGLDKVIGSYTECNQLGACIDGRTCVYAGYNTLRNTGARCAVQGDSLNQTIATVSIDKPEVLLSSGCLANQDAFSSNGQAGEACCGGGKVECASGICNAAVNTVGQCVAIENAGQSTSELAVGVGFENNTDCSKANGVVQNTSSGYVLKCDFDGNESFGYHQPTGYIYGNDAPYACKKLCSDPKTDVEASAREKYQVAKLVSATITLDSYQENADEQVQEELPTIFQNIGNRIEAVVGTVRELFLNDSDLSFEKPLNGGIGLVDNTAMNDGGMQVEQYCTKKNYKIINDDDNWYCVDDKNQKVETLEQEDFDVICNQTYYKTLKENNTIAVAAQTGTNKKAAHNWLCYPVAE